METNNERDRYYKLRIRLASDSIVVSRVGENEAAVRLSHAEAKRAAYALLLAADGIAP